MDKNVTVTISLSTNPDVDGRYFIDVRDTTRVENPRHAHQLTTRTRHRKEALGFLDDLRAEARKQGVRVTVKDETGELPV